MIAAGALVAGCGASREVSSGDGACAAPLTLVADTVVTPGMPLRVTAENLVDECYDQGEGLLIEPLADQPVTWRQGADEIELDIVDAVGHGGTVDVMVTVPAEARPARRVSP